MRKVAAGLVTAAAIGLIVRLNWPQGLPRQIRIEGRLPPYPPTQETARAEVWFPEQRILFDSMGRQWYRNECGQKSQRMDANSHYQALLSDSHISITLTLTSWAPPRRCTVRFQQEGTITRYARNAPCNGWGRNLTVSLPTLTEPVLLDDELHP